MCYFVTHMAGVVGIRELRQNLSRYIDRVKAGEALVVTERGREVARLIPSGPAAEPYGDLAERFGSTVPIERVETIAGRLRARSRAAGTTDAHLAEGRGDRAG